MTSVFPILMPQLNVNDEVVQLGVWLVEKGASVSPGDLLCEVETSKALVELPAERAGVVFPIATANSSVKIGTPIGWLGSSLSEIESFLAEHKHAKPQSNGAGSIRATPKAQAL